MSYVEHAGTLASPDIVHFNHGLAEIITAVTDLVYALWPSRNTIRFRGIHSAAMEEIAVASTGFVRRRNGYRSRTRSKPSSRRDPLPPFRHATVSRKSELSLPSMRRAARQPAFGGVGDGGGSRSSGAPHGVREPAQAKVPSGLT